MGSRGSATTSALLTGPAFIGELSCPSFYLRSQPELDATIAKLPNRTRHIAIPMLIDADGVAVGEAEEFRDAVRVKEVIYVYLPAHRVRLLQYSDPSEPRDRLQ
jgi:hypothetical protein